MPSAVYFDHNATTPLDPRVRDAMLPWLGEKWGNPSSVHGFGQSARDAVEEGRARVAALLGARPAEVIFTASGTEANNTVLQHLCREAGYRGQLVVSALEHPSIREAARQMAGWGMTVVWVPPQADGVVDPDRFLAALTSETRLAVLMLANNELGTLQPVEAVAHGCRQRQVPLHCDATQAAGKVAVDVEALGVDFVTLGAHKFHGPLGAAALWMRSGVEIAPLLLGGGQERRRRAGTENVPAIVGLGKCAELAQVELPARRAHLGALRDRLEAGLVKVPGARIHGRESPRLPNVSHVAFPGIEGEALTIRLDIAGYAVSTGSACASGVVEPSPTLLAMGLSPEEALGSLRISFGMTNSLAEVETFLPVLAGEVEELRRRMPETGVRAGSG